MRTRIDLILYFILLIPFSVNAQQTKEEIVSTKTGDTYEIIIRKPKIFDTAKFYHLVYIFLSNRVNPTRNNPVFAQLSVRGKIQDAIIEAIKN